MLPEGEEDRILRAADVLLRRNVADLTLLGDPMIVRAKAAHLGIDISAARVLSPYDEELRDKHGYGLAATVAATRAIASVTGVRATVATPTRGGATFAATVADPQPAIRALFAAASGLDDWTQQRVWERVVELQRDPTTTTVALGAFDAARMKADYDLIQGNFEGAQPFDVEKAYTNAFLDTSIRMTAG